MAGGYVVVIEGDAQEGFSAYSPDVPGCIATGRTREECLDHVREAIAFHIEGMIEDGEPVPPPSGTDVVLLAPPAA